jgi:hypothetical protein
MLTKDRSRGNTKGRQRVELGVAVLLTLSSCSDPPPPPYYGPYWTYELVTPNFVVKEDSVSTSFVGHVFPQTHFIFGAGDGVSFDKPNARLTFNATSVWQYAPVTVDLFDGPVNTVGTSTALVAHWEVPPPPLDGPIDFVNSQSLRSRTPVWVVVDLPAFSGSCILEVLGHD